MLPFYNTGWAIKSGRLQSGLKVQSGLKLKVHSSCVVESTNLLMQRIETFWLPFSHYPGVTVTRAGTNPAPTVMKQIQVGAPEPRKGERGSHIFLKDYLFNYAETVWAI